MLCVMAAAALFVHGCGDSSGDATSSATLPATTSSTGTTTTTAATSATRPVSSTTATPASTSGPATTTARASDATAQAFFEAWVGNDAAKLAANGEAAAVAQATALSVS